VWAGEQRRPLGGPRQLALLGLLAVHSNQAVASDRILTALWGPDSGPGAKRLQMAVARLRSALDTPGGEGPNLRTVGGGYLLAVPPGELDAEVFASAVQEGRQLLDAGQGARAAEILDGALDLWRGPPLAEVTFLDFAQPEIRRLEELRLLAVETRADAHLQQGLHRAIIGQLEALVAEHPDRERLAGQLMLALYRDGRQSDALQVFQRVRSHLIRELGISPGPALTTLHTQILKQAPELEQTPGTRPRSPRSTIPADAARAGAEAGDHGQSLPTPASPMIGRQRETEAVLSLLLGPQVQLVTLAGPGGVGKTRLALAAAQAAQPAFPDGCSWIELAGVASAADVGSAMLRALGITPLGGEAAAEALPRHLRDRLTLIVIDNFEHVLDAAGLVGELLATSRKLTILVTSREPLRLRAEHVVRVAPLPVPQANATLAQLDAVEASRLFLESARRHDSRFAIDPADAPVAARVCARLDGLPLALELAAARTTLLGVTELEAQLDRALNDLAGGPRDAPARHRTLHATIEWSYRLLEPSLQEVFAHFAIFAGGASLASAAIVTGAPLSAFEALISRSLLERRSPSDAGTRLEMLDTVSAFAARRLSERDTQHTLRERHLDHYLAIVENEADVLFTHREPEALAVLDREADNTVSALRWALEARPLAALRLAGLLGAYWFVRSDQTGRNWLHAALNAAGDSAPVADRARAQRWLASQLQFEEPLDAALAAHRAALKLYRQIQDHAGISRCYCSLSAITWRIGKHNQRARAYAQASLRHAELTGSAAVIGSSLSELAPYLSPDQRPAVIERADRLLTAVGDNWGLARLYIDCGYETLAEDRCADALPLLERAVTYGERLHTSLSLASALGNLGLAQLFSGHHALARQTLDRQLRLSVGQPFGFTASEALQALAALMTTGGEFARAARLLGAATNVGPGAGDERIFRRLDRDYFQPARARSDADVWRREQSAGAALAYEQAIAYALERP
jgi:predicted ATPase/DNA-binding SARP family transcriptional activator